VRCRGANDTEDAINLNVIGSRPQGAVILSGNFAAGSNSRYRSRCGMGCKRGRSAVFGAADTGGPPGCVPARPLEEVQGRVLPVVR